MPIDRATLEAHLARLNEQRPKGKPAHLEDLDEATGRFTLSYPDRGMPEGQCIDQDFTEIQWALHEKGITTGIQGARQDDEGRYHILYEVVEWD